MGQYTGKISEEILQEIVRCLVTEFDPEQIILFGSQAWGIPTEDSDVDLYVIIANTTERPLSLMYRAEACLSDECKFATDILIKTRSDAEKYRTVAGSLDHKVFTRGRILYER